MRVSGAAIAFAVALASAGCRVDVDYGGTRYQCPDGVSCPPGYTCVDDVCVPDTDDPDAGPTPDAAMNPDGAVDPGACGGPAAIAESFSDDVITWAEIAAWGGATATVSGGRLEIDLPADPGESTGGHIRSWMAFDHRDATTSFELVQSVDPTSTGSVELVLTYDWSDYVEFYLVEGQLSMKSWVADSIVSQEYVAFSATEHRWWRFRDSTGTLYWETSPDGQTWTERHATPTPDYLDTAFLWLSAYGFAGGGAPGTVAFDELNGGDTARTPWCAFAETSDDFDDGDLGRRWYPWSSNCVTEVSSGRLRLAPTADTTGSCGFDLMTAHSLVDSSVHVEVPSVLEVSDATSWFVVRDFTGNEVSIVEQGGWLGFWRCAPGCDQLGSTAYEPATARFWRVREAGGTMYWETSPDAATWTTHESRATPFDVSQVSVTLGVTTVTPSTTPGETTYDNFAVVP